jgi:hypothetical protein
MLTKYSVFMMLLIVTASLVGISSIYQPANVETQPQPQPLLGSPQQKLQQQSNIGTLMQIKEDKELVDRLFPYIIQKIDGKTLLQKIDGKLLAQKVFPYLDLNVATIERPGQGSNVDITGFTTKTTIVKASCAPEERLVGGAMALHNVAELNSFQRSQQPQEPNSWAIITSFDGDGSIRSFAECLKVELALKDVPKSQPVQSLVGPAPQLQKPSQPPGGSPQRTLPEFMK